MPDPILLHDLEDGVLLIRFNRPERNNAWTGELEDLYFEALIGAARDPAVRVVVVTGNGRSFCPGIDMAVLSAAADGQHVRQPRRPMTLARSIPKPVIAAINGACAGIGFTQACASDIRFAARGAKMTTAFARRGLPAENSLSWILPKLVGTGRAMDLLLSARVVLAEEAHSFGLVDFLSEPATLLDDALRYARDIASNCSPQSLAVIKRQLQEDWERSAEHSSALALRLVPQLQAGPDFTEGVRSYTDKRAPDFEGASFDADVPAV